MKILIGQSIMNNIMSRVDYFLVCIIFIWRLPYQKSRNLVVSKRHGIRLDTPAKLITLKNVCSLNSQLMFDSTDLNNKIKEFNQVTFIRLTIPFKRCDGRNFENKVSMMIHNVVSDYSNKSYLGLPLDSVPWSKIVTLQIKVHSI